MACYVKIYHGPYEAFFTLSHKPQKLCGLRDKLLKLGYRVDLVPVEYRDHCVLEMCGHEVFRCNIKNLLFNCPADVDTVCMRAVAAVEEAKRKLLRAKTYLWLWYLIQDQMFKRGEYAPRDYWPVVVDPLPPISQVCGNCNACCNSLLTILEGANVKTS